MAATIQNPTPSRATLIASLMPMITVTLALLYAAGAYFLLFKGKVESLLPGGSLDALGFEARAADDKAYLDKLSSAETAFEKLNAQRRAQVAGIVPLGPDTPGLMIQMEALARDNGFALTSFDASADEKNISATGRKVLRATANFSGGDYQQFKRLLGAMENALRVIDPQSVVFSTGATSFSVSFNAYYLDPAAAGKPTPKPITP